MRSDRWYRALLRILPLDFRSDYGEEMTRTFREQRQDAAALGRAGVARVWWENIVALLSIGPREHLAQLRQDVRYALRGMRRNPGFVTVATLTLALAIGANTAIFSIVHAVPLRPLPSADQSTLVAVWNRWTGTESAALSDPEYLDYTERSRTMKIAAVTGTNTILSGGVGDAERVQGAIMTANALEVFGVAPAIGRGFTPGRGGPRTRTSGADLRSPLEAPLRGGPAGRRGRPSRSTPAPYEVVRVRPGSCFRLTSRPTDAPTEVVLPLTLVRATRVDPVTALCGPSRF